MYKTKFLECWRAVLPLVASCLGFTSVARAAATPELFNLDIDKSRLEWRLPNGTAGTGFPLSLQIYRVSKEAKYSIGFSHLGYSEKDPDGKAASLTITLRPFIPKNANPSSLVDGIGFEFLEFQATELDVTLKTDSAEEQRLKAALKLPRPIAELDASIPYQIKWKGVDGDQLHSWLTKSDGLRWIISGVAKLRLRVTVRERINSDCVKVWWERRVNGDPVQESLLDPASVAMELLADGCLEVESASSISRSVSPQYLALVVSGLQKYFDPASKYASLTVERITTAAKPETFQQEAIALIRLKTVQIPGQFLSANPSYVKDLSGNSIGLDGLLGKK